MKYLEVTSYALETPNTWYVSSKKLETLMWYIEDLKTNSDDIEYREITEEEYKTKEEK